MSSDFFMEEESFFKTITIFQIWEIEISDVELAF